MYTMDYYSAMKNCHWNYETVPLVATGMDNEEGLTYTNQISQSREDNSTLLSSMQDDKRDAKELIYNTKGDSENSDTKCSPPLHKKVKGQGWIRNLWLTYTQLYVSVIDNPQGVSPTFIPFFHTYKEICISNIYTEICIYNRKSTRITSFLPHIYVNQYLQ